MSEGTGVPELALLIDGADRPGVLAALTRVIYEHGANHRVAFLFMLRARSHHFFESELHKFAIGGVDSRTLC